MDVDAAKRAFLAQWALDTLPVERAASDPGTTLSHQPRLCLVFFAPFKSLKTSLYLSSSK